MAAQTITHVPLYTFHGDNISDEFGESVSVAGDVDGDGIPDFIVGAPTRRSTNGYARVFSGSNGSVLYSFEVDGTRRFGQSVSGAGDVNGDGRADLIVGENSSARVFSGSDGSVLYSFDGDSSGDQFGFSVSGAGDVNGDGNADLIVGAPFDDNNGSNSGSARVLSGSDGSVLYDFNGESVNDWFGVSVSGAGDINGDGVADLIVGASGNGPLGFARVFSGSDGSVLYNFNGNDVSLPVDLFGQSVSGAGDVNGDGIDDFIVGAPGPETVFRSGHARVLSGSDGSTLFEFHGFFFDSFESRFGGSVSGAGDVNGDGKADLIVGARFDDNNGLNSGSAHVLSGSDGSVLYKLTGELFDSFGVSVSGVGDINEDGIDDFIVGSRSGGANDGGYAQVYVSQISPFLLGDCNQNGFVDFSDISPFISILSSGGYLAEADTNGDEVVDFADIALFISILSS